MPAQDIAALLLTALLFGGMTLFSFAFAAFLFKSLPADRAGALLRRAFPLFYLWVIATASLAASFRFSRDSLGGAVLAAVALSAVPARQWLMPAINRATDRGDKSSFALLHGLSVVITLGHIAATAVVLARFLL